MIQHPLTNHSEVSTGAGGLLFLLLPVRSAASALVPTSLSFALLNNLPAARKCQLLWQIAQTERKRPRCKPLPGQLRVASARRTPGET